MATQLVMIMVTVQRYIRCQVHPVSLMMCKSRADIEILPVATPTMPKIWDVQFSKIARVKFSIPRFCTSQMC